MIIKAKKATAFAVEDAEDVRGVGAHRIIRLSPMRALSFLMYRKTQYEWRHWRNDGDSFREKHGGVLRADEGERASAEFCYSE